MLVENYGRKEKLSISNKMLLNIVTPVTRPGNLHILKSYIENNIIGHFDVKWYCIYDPGKNNEIVENKEEWIISKYGGIKNDCGGGTQRNEALDMIEDGWICFMDDDTLFYDNYGKLLKEIITNNESYSVFIVNEKRSEFSLLAKPDNIRVGYIDMAQIILSSKIISSIRFIENVYQSDYYFIESVYNANKEKFMFVNQFLCYYNYLRQ